MVPEPKRSMRVNTAVINRGNGQDMTSCGVFGAHRRNGMPMWKPTPEDDEARKIRAALERIDECGDLRNVAVPRSEKLALVTFVGRRGLIAWQKSSGKYELTPAGRKWLIAHGGVARVHRKKFPSRLVAATLGVTVLVGAWFSAAASNRIFNPPPSNTATIAQVSPTYAKLDPMASHAEVGKMNLPADRHQLTLIRTDAPVYAAPRRAGAKPGDAPPPVVGQPSQAPDQATKKVAKTSHKASRVARQSDNRGSALAFFETPFRGAPQYPSRGAPQFPSWGIGYPDRHTWR